MQALSNNPPIYGCIGRSANINGGIPPALPDIEPGMRRIRGHCHLPALHQALQVELNLLPYCENFLRSATMGALTIHIIKCRYYYITDSGGKRLLIPCIDSSRFFGVGSHFLALSANRTHNPFSEKPLRSPTLYKDVFKKPARSS
jgi:hypothetical protein